jgi:aminoglycoside phosphotransferase (APT) family kinase protein
MASISVDDLARLTDWFTEQLPDASIVRLEGVEAVDLGHSAETLLLTVAWVADDDDHHQDVVVRLRPVEPGLLPPYDLPRQVTILRALESTAVRAPKALWHEPTGTVLGREFYVMERLPGEVYEQTLPEGIEAEPEKLRRMCFGIVEQLAAIHLVDLQATGLHAVADGRCFLDRELDHWEAEIRRLQRGPLPAIERLLAEVRARRPEPCPPVTLVHGDPKPGNVAFVGSEVSAVFDWELATIGDPLADLAWLELLWGFPVGLPSVPGAPTVDEIVARYEELTGITARHREWYRAFQGLKMVVINLSGSMMYDRGESDDPKLKSLGYAVHWMTQRSLLEFGITEELESGPVLPRSRY